MKKFAPWVIYLTLILFLFFTSCVMRRQIELKYTSNIEAGLLKSNTNTEIVVNKFADNRMDPLILETTGAGQYGELVHVQWYAKNDVSELVTNAVIEELQKVGYKVTVPSGGQTSSGYSLTGRITRLEKSAWDGDATLDVEVTLKKGETEILKKSYTGNGEKFTITVNSPVQINLALNDFLRQLIVDLVPQIQKYSQTPSGNGD